MRRIVCIDDDKHILDLNKKLLEASGEYQVTCFNSGRKGIGHIKEHKPDLILLDVMMPGMDGISVMQLLKKDPDTRTIPVIFMTAQKTQTDVNQYMSMGALSVITKPIDLDTFAVQMKMLTKIIMD